LSANAPPPSAPHLPGAGQREYHPLRYRLGGRERFLLWWHGHVPGGDGVWVDGAGIAPSFASRQDLGRFAAAQGIALPDDEPGLHDLDAVDAWLPDPRPEAVDCATWLEAWNLLNDLAASCGVSLRDRSRWADAAYETLFGWGLPPSTPEAWSPPTWRAAEIRAMRAVLSRGMALLRDRVRPA
jgi:hypothetical protein